MTAEATNNTTQSEESKNGKYFFRSECRGCGCLTKPDQEISHLEYDEYQSAGRQSEFVSTEAGTINGYDVVLGGSSLCKRCDEEDRFAAEKSPAFMRL